MCRNSSAMKVVWHNNSSKRWKRKIVNVAWALNKPWRKWMKRAMQWNCVFLLSVFQLVPKKKRHWPVNMCCNNDSLNSSFCQSYRTIRPRTIYSVVKPRCRLWGVSFHQMIALLGSFFGRHVPVRTKIFESWPAEISGMTKRMIIPIFNCYYRWFSLTLTRIIRWIDKH